MQHPISLADVRAAAERLDRIVTRAHGAEIVTCRRDTESSDAVVMAEASSSTHVSSAELALLDDMRRSLFAAERVGLRCGATGRSGAGARAIQLVS